MKPDNSFAKHLGSSRQVWEGGVESVLFVATGFLHATLLIPSGGLCLCGYVPRRIFNDKKDPRWTQSPFAQTSVPHSLVSEILLWGTLA